MNTSAERHIQNGAGTPKARGERGNAVAQLLWVFRALLKPRGYKCWYHWASVHPHLLSHSRRHWSSSRSLHSISKEQSGQSHLQNVHNLQSLQGSTGTFRDRNLTSGAHEWILSAQTSSGLGLGLLKTSGDFSNLHPEVFPKSLQLLEEWVLLPFNKHYNQHFFPTPKSLETSPLSAGIISSRRMGMCSEVGDTSY